MAQVKDPVCGMLVDTFSPGGRAILGGSTFYFCSDACQRQFESNPTRYIDGTIRADAPVKQDRESSEAPRTEAGGIVAPKFGSAGSGGAELDPIIDPHAPRKS